MTTGTSSKGRRNVNPPFKQGDVVISTKNVSKKFCKRLRRSMAYGIMDLAQNLAGIKPRSDRLKKDEFWALDGINFELRRGEALGLIGANGSGKTTLLRMLSGILPPDRGEIAIKGTVGALIAVGAGFHPHMTGRENIYLNGSILGMSRKEIDSKFKGIVDFAEIGDFLDAPVSTYSSGMHVRLGFSIATAIEPDILLLDEILAVGDARFRNRCYNRMGNIRNRAAIVFVSHSMEVIAQFCDKCLYLERGRIAHYGEVDQGISMYLENNKDDYDSSSFLNVFEPITSANFGFSSTDIQYGESIDMTISIDSSEDLKDNLLRIVLYDSTGLAPLEWNSRRNGMKVDLVEGTNTILVRLGPLHLKNGQYGFGIVLNDSGGIREIVRSFKEYYLNVDGKNIGTSPYQLPGHPGDCVEPKRRMDRQWQ